MVNVKVYYSVSEIQSEKGFRDDNPVSKDTYKALLGDYNFPEVEVKCCYQKENGRLCTTDHKRGLVVSLVDSSVSIVGNCCGKTKLGEVARSDVTRYENEQSLLENIKALNDLLDTKAQRLQALVDAESILKSLSSSIDKFLAEFGSFTRSRLEQMSKTGGSSVFCAGVTLREYLDEDGYKKVERRAAQIRVGVINDLSILNKAAMREVRSEISGVRKAFFEAEKITRDSKISTIKKIAAAISNGDRIPVRVEEQVTKLDKFFTNNFLVLCFVTSNKVERQNNAKFAMQRLGMDTSKEKAKAWLREKERELESLHKVNKIEI